ESGKEGWGGLRGREGRGEDRRVNTGSKSAKALRNEGAGKFACVAFPDRKKRGHADAGEVSFAISTEVFEEDIAEGNLLDTFLEIDAKSLFHTCLVDRIYTLGRDAHFVQRQGDGLRLELDKFSAGRLHADAVVGCCDGCEEGSDAIVALPLNSMQSHGGIFATRPTEQDGFRHGRVSFRSVAISVWFVAEVRR